MIMRLARPLSACVALLLLSGCAGYRLGTTTGTAAGVRLLQIDPFTNQTLEPRLSDAVATALRRQTQQDGTYHLATHGRADVVVGGAITQYRRHELSFVPNDVLTVKDFRVTVTAHVTARETATGKVLFDQTVTGFTLVQVGTDLTSAERQALPLLADDLARKITALLADGTW
jgi:hypothetical protein